MANYTAGHRSVGFAQERSCDDGLWSSMAALTRLYPWASVHLAGHNLAMNHFGSRDRKSSTTCAVRRLVG